MTKPGALIKLALCALGLSIGLLNSAAAQTPTFYDYVIVNEYPHDTDAFTQGLFVHDGILYESTGQYGQSRLRRLGDLTGEAEQSTNLPRRIFGEGSTSIGDEIFVLSWRSQTAFVFDRQTLKQKKTFRYQGEGWGLTDDGERLIMSDGSPTITFRNPADFSIERQITVRLGDRPIRHINELEWIKGEIFANVWHSDKIIRIDPATGAVTAIIDLHGLLKDDDITPGVTDVLNGIAYDPDTDRLFVTGKNWPKIFEINLLPREPQQ